MTPGAGRPVADPASWAVETTMYRALAVLRAVVLGFAVVLNLLKWDGLARPWLAVAALAVMAVWTGVAAWAYDAPRRRGPVLLVADLGLAVALVLLTPLVQSDAQIAAMTSTLPSFWVMASLLAWGVHWNLTGGLVAATFISAADLSIRTTVDGRNIGNLFLLMVGGPLIGYCSGLLKRMAEERDLAEREAAAAAERARLARVVHDGVLQVLALVQRRGAELGGDAAELGRLAGEQEAALRSMVQRDAAVLGEGANSGRAGRGGRGPGSRSTHGGSPAATADLAATLSQLAAAHVNVSTPGDQVPLPAPVVDELAAVVRACLDNVRVHVGADAPAWVLLEDLGSSVVVTVRDEGPGIADGRLDEAERQGRIGVSSSIRGRVAELGGSVRLFTSPGQGTEWEITVPRR